MTILDHSPLPIQWTLPHCSPAEPYICFCCVSEPWRCEPGSTVWLNPIPIYRLSASLIPCWSKTPMLAVGVEMSDCISLLVACLPAGTVSQRRRNGKHMCEETILASLNDWAAYGTNQLLIEPLEANARHLINRVVLFFFLPPYRPR